MINMSEACTSLFRHSGWEHQAVHIAQTPLACSAAPLCTGPAPVAIAGSYIRETNAQSYHQNWM